MDLCFCLIFVVIAVLEVVMPLFFTYCLLYNEGDVITFLLPGTSLIEKLQNNKPKLH